MTSPHEPPAVAMLAARLARAFPSLSAYSSASLAVELCRIERAQHRHAERCCSGEDGGYVRIRSLGRDDDNAGRPIVREHDPEAEERAGQRILLRCGSWRAKLRELASDGHVRPGDPVIELQHDPRGRVLLVRLPGEAEPVGV